MRFSAITLTLALCAGSVQSAFILSSKTHRPLTTQSAQKYGPDVESLSEPSSHNVGCPCCVGNSFTMTPREARVKAPLKALFASGVMTTLTAPAYADEEEIETEQTEQSVAIAEIAEEEVLLTEQPVADAEPAPIASEESSAAAELATEAVVEDTPKSFDSALAQFFPRAQPTSVISTKVQDSLGRRKFTRYNTIFGTSVCPDEINNKPSKSLTAALQNSLTDLNGAYTLGGLGGLPFMGVSGMRNFLSHSPGEGKVVIMYGPHVGISDDGRVGYVERLGMKKVCCSCDTTLQAYRAIQDEAGSIADAPSDSSKHIGGSDKREEYIITKLRAAMDTPEGKLVNEEAMPAFLTIHMFDMVQEVLMKQLNTCWEEHDAWAENIDEIVLLGGVTINRGQVNGSIEAREDYFQPLVFQSFKNTGKPGPLSDSKDLFKDTFGERPTPFFA